MILVSLFGRAVILVIFGLHFGRNEDLILNLTDYIKDQSYQKMTITKVALLFLKILM